MKPISYAIALVGFTGGFVTCAPTAEARHDALLLRSTTFQDVNATQSSNTNERRAEVNYSGFSCTSTCSGTAGQGPNESDCNNIIMYLWGQGATLMPPISSPGGWGMAFGSCDINLYNTSPSTDTVRYQYNLFGSVADYLRSACNAAHGYAEGKCQFDGHPGVYIHVKHA